jgi:prepilin-type N-terminal cleavage/methylation domain-containing protein
VSVGSAPAPPRPAPGRGRRARRNGRGWTLIELLAVVAMFALIAGMVLPNLRFGGDRAVRHAAERLGDAIEFARQRAIMTGREHRVVMDLDAGRYHVEWAPPPDPESEETATPPAPAGSRHVDLEPPPAASGVLEFEPVPGSFGRVQPLGRDVVFFDVVFPDSIVNTGAVELALGPDGATDPATVTLADPDDEARYEVDVQALADVVHIARVQR